MKNLILAIVLINSVSYYSYSQEKTNNMETINNQWIINDLVKKWENNRKYTLQVLKIMPEEYYDFSPVDKMMTFKEQVVHVAKGFNFQLKTVVNFRIPKIDNSNKETILKSYEQIFDSLIVYFKELDSVSLHIEAKAWFGNTTNLRIFNLMDNHLAHHRGQTLVYLRLKGIQPPSYIGW